MKIECKTRNDERLILTGMIVDDIVISRISHKWAGQMFKSRWSNLIAKWCIKYHKKYNQAPKNQIESLFETWAAKTKNKESLNLIENFLGSLSDEYEALAEECNPDYTIDMAGRYFNQVKIENLIEELQDSVELNEIEEADKYITDYHKIELGVGEGINVLQDKSAIKEAFQSKQKPLITFPGALGQFFQHALERDGFIGLMGKEGIGKSFLLQEFAFRAMLQRKKVALFEVGDQSKNQIMLRLMTRISMHPRRKGIIDYPSEIYKDDDKNIEIEFTEKRFREGLDFKVAWKACQRTMKQKVKSKYPYLKLSVHPNSTLPVQGIRSILETWEQDMWVPDVIVIDYADILDMSYKGLEGRDLINQAWKEMRAMSQQYHCLVITATQTDAASYETGLLRRKNFSDSKNKYSHVTGMIGINQTDEEKDMGLYRFNWLKLRDGVYTETHCVNVANCLALANPMIKSCW